MSFEIFLNDGFTYRIANSNFSLLETQKILIKFYLIFKILAVDLYNFLLVLK